MPDFTLREYTNEEYHKDMEELLKGKGLSGAVKVYLDKIAEEASGMPYISHATIQEYLCDIQYLAQMADEVFEEQAEFIRMMEDDGK